MTARKTPVPTNGRVDPTLNIRELIDAAACRQDDLRTAETQRVNQEFEAERRRHEAETKRVDALRAVDIAAVATANERALEQAAVLASQVATSAETLRALVASTAVTIARQLDQLSTQLSDRISALEKASYEGAGRQRMTDPQMVELLAEVKALNETRAKSSGKGAGLTAMWGYLVAAVMLGATLWNLLGK